MSYTSDTKGDNTSCMCSFSIYGGFSKDGTTKLSNFYSNLKAKLDGELQAIIFKTIGSKNDLTLDIFIDYINKDDVGPLEHFIDKLDSTFGRVEWYYKVVLPSLVLRGVSRSCWERNCRTSLLDLAVLYNNIHALKLLLRKGFLVDERLAILKERKDDKVTGVCGYGDETSVTASEIMQRFKIDMGHRLIELCQHVEPRNTRGVLRYRNTLLSTVSSALKTVDEYLKPKHQLLPKEDMFEKTDFDRRVIDILLKNGATLLKACREDNYKPESRDKVITLERLKELLKHKNRLFYLTDLLLWERIKTKEEFATVLEAIDLDSELLFSVSYSILTSMMTGNISALTNVLKLNDRITGKGELMAPIEPMIVYLNYCRPSKKLGWLRTSLAHIEVWRYLYACDANLTRYQKRIQLITKEREAKAKERELEDLILRTKQQSSDTSKYQERLNELLVRKKPDNFQYLLCQLHRKRNLNGLLRQCRFSVLIYMRNRYSFRTLRQKGIKETGHIIQSKLNPSTLPDEIIAPHFKHRSDKGLTEDLLRQVAYTCGEENIIFRLPLVSNYSEQPNWLQLALLNIDVRREVFLSNFGDDITGNFCFAPESLKREIFTLLCCFKRNSKKANMYITHLPTYLLNEIYTHAVDDAADIITVKSANISILATKKSNATELPRNSEWNLALNRRQLELKHDWHLGFHAKHFIQIDKTSVITTTPETIEGQDDEITEGLDETTEEDTTSDDEMLDATDDVIATTIEKRHITKEGDKGHVDKKPRIKRMNE